MKKAKRTAGLLLALVLLLNILTPTRAVEGDGISLSMTAPGESVTMGGTVTLTIGADRDFASRGCGITICYDASILEPDLEASAATGPFRIDGPLSVAGKTALRISFLPGSKSEHIRASEPLAVLRFKALSQTADTAITMDGAYLYNAALREIPVNMPETVHVSVEAAEEYTPVTGITLDRTELVLGTGKTAMLSAAIEPAQASDTTVFWTSSDHNIVQVADGKVYAISEGRAAVTATTKDGGFTATCQVTVLPPDAQYTVDMPADMTAVIGDRIQIPIVVSHEDGKTGYNAFDITFTYDPAVLELMSTTISGVTVTHSPGTINILGYGQTRSANTVPFVLEFKALNMEDTEVEITSARVDNSGNAAVKNVSAATLIDHRTAIGISGYPVTLSEGIVGANTARPGADYTFSLPEDYYDYFVTVMVNGRVITPTCNADGSYTIPADLINGAIVISVTRTGKVFDVTLGTDMTGDRTAQYGVDYQATLHRDENYRYSVFVTIDGQEYTGYGMADDVYTIPGGDLVGDIVITVIRTPVEEPEPSVPTEPSEPTEPVRPTEPTDPAEPTEPENPTEPGGVTEPEEPTEPNEPTNPSIPTEPTRPTDPTKPAEPTAPSEPKDPATPTDPIRPGEPAPQPPHHTAPQTMHSVIFTGTGAGAAQGNPASVVHGGSYVFTLKKEAGYDYVVSYCMGGKPAVTISPVAGDTYVISNVTAPLEIIIVKTPQRNVTVCEYLTLDEKSVFLVQVTGVLDSGKIFTFDGNAMYYSEAYDAWVYPVIEQGEFDVAAAAHRITAAVGTASTVAPSSGDVNGSGMVDLADAQLIYSLYNAQQEDFFTVGMVKFLYADMNRDKKIDVRDAMAVIYEIQQGKEG